MWGVDQRIREIVDQWIGGLILLDMSLVCLAANRIDVRIQLWFQESQALNVSRTLFGFYETSILRAPEPEASLFGRSSGIVKELDVITKVISTIPFGDVGSNGVGGLDQLFANRVACESLPAITSCQMSSQRDTAAR